MKEIESPQNLEKLLATNKNINNYAFQGMNLKGFEIELIKKKLEGCLFLGCELSLDFQQKLVANKNIIIPNFDVPFKTSVSTLYTKESLYNDYDYKNSDSYYQTYDKIVYEHYLKTGKGNPKTIYEALARRLHDHSITDALMDKLKGVEPKKIIAIMGGHGLSRKSKDYIKIVKLSKILAEKGCFLLSGGGPGAMGATHLGVWFAEREMHELEEGLEILKKAPLYNHENWLSTAFELIGK